MRYWTGLSLTVNFVMIRLEGERRAAVNRGQSIKNRTPP
jgi:hypothetical protein